ncbi:amidohydrolase family protein, partial [Acinetobacter baumannii]
EDKFGHLGIGQRADFIIVDRDPTQVTPEDLRKTQVLETWVGGEQVWVRK